MKNYAVVWPDINQEIGEYKKYFTGKVLNAGAGGRDISDLVDGELFNQDIAEGTHNTNIDIFSPLHKIPKEDGFFDTIICNAVLEHVANPDEVMTEFYRVLKPRGILYLVIPFLQPEHLDPTDFQRYTKDGITKLAENHEFEVLKVDPMHNIYHTLAWIVERWLWSKHTLIYKTLRFFIFPLLRYKCVHSTNCVASAASAHRLLARKK